MNQNSSFDISWDRFCLPFSERVLIMGVLNVTPDSFFDGGMYVDTDEACRRAFAMAEQGADIIDIGGESTRPGAGEVDPDIQIERTVPVIKRIATELDIPVSIDTRDSNVAMAALENGASFVNDVSGLRHDKSMAKVVAKAGVPVAVMHMRGTPETMQRDVSYKDLMKEIQDQLRESIRHGREAGINGDRIIIDPGIGFGKTGEHNLQIIKYLHELKSLGRPILVGVSRKSFVGHVLAGVEPKSGSVPTEERLFGTASATALAIANGASMIRVHDVREMSDVAKVAYAIRDSV